MKESAVERHLRKRVMEWGGTAEKFTSPGTRSVPDRLVTWPWGDMDLVEMKAPGARPRPDQVRDHQRRAKLGVPVYVLNTKEQVDAYVWARSTRHKPMNYMSVSLPNLPGAGHVLVNGGDGWDFADAG